MIQPPYLKPGNKVAITGVARKLSKADVQNGIDALESHGFVPIVSKTIGVEHNIFSGNDELRFTELQGYLNDPEIKAVWLARGGYGTIRILEKIDWTGFKVNPKWLIGFSDITNLLAKANDLGFASLHGPMPKTIDYNFEEDVSANLLFQYLKGAEPKYQWKTSEACHSGNIKAEIVGGNLATLSHLYSSLNRDFFDHKILFIEEVDEYLYAIDRMLRAMKISGRFNRLNGVIVGDFSGIKDNDDPFGESIQQIVKNVFGDLDIPIAFGLKAGHENTNWPLVLGKSYRLKSQNGTWVLK
ncbi:MAG: LD-carboxypeptidase [Bacteroidia bacterium]